MRDHFKTTPSQASARMAKEIIDVDHISSDQFGKYALLSATLHGRPTVAIGIISGVQHSFDEERRVNSILTLQIYDGDGMTNFVQAELRYDKILVCDEFDEVLKHLNEDDEDGDSD